MYCLDATTGAVGGRMMYGYISGFTDANNITYCPKCGAEITDFYSDGTAWCRKCDFRFGVVECEEE